MSRPVLLSRRKIVPVKGEPGTYNIGGTLVDEAALVKLLAEVRELDWKRNPKQAKADAASRALAKEQYHSDGEIEIDDSAPCSRGDDPGCYVQAWVWVDDSEEET